MNAEFTFLLAADAMLVLHVLVILLVIFGWSLL